MDKDKLLKANSIKAYVEKRLNVKINFWFDFKHVSFYLKPKDINFYIKLNISGADFIMLSYKEIGELLITNFNIKLVNLFKKENNNDNQTTN